MFAAADGTWSIIEHYSKHTGEAFVSEYNIYTAAAASHLCAFI